MQLRHLAVPVDVDATADQAFAERLVDDAASLAHQLGAKVTLLHVAVPVTSPVLQPDAVAAAEAFRAMQDVLEARNASAARRLADLAARARKAGVVVDEKLITSGGTVQDLIVDTAHAIGADVIIMSTHARKGLARVVLGSVAERTAHKSALPVLLIPPGK